ncbi:MAG: hypothetical protein COV59_04675 [Candidatus Magasanikbacteria bacterium CG11_big_fil_rev_8_21_14_0_20_39_34]|uniref:ATP-grasp domain-containing protein n=1 Tax=Candidatus Magasanikbacteria bacterium CG11_big_fil_rev_8_21_14_0_20_39_34 TaxID=1974653 RepID=A0A2H0N6K8_9BACT|nr:MAG: hypothetical protein COV59_04675 [Candidatus Magasanikbacteria bacterium CG11_big_fil_rev_8_21_14_0_20_39_34]
MKKQSQKNIILYVGKFFGSMIADLRRYEKKQKTKFRIAYLFDLKNTSASYQNKLENNVDILIPCNPSSDISIQKALLPYQDELFAVTFRGEDQASLFQKIIPHVPYMKTPTETSLTWATEKLSMRRRLYTADKKITPSYTVVSDTSRASMKKIEEKVGFPLIVKPSGLAASRLVSICYHKEELKVVLDKVFKKIHKVYKETQGRGEPKVLVEQFMEGEMYSIDIYITSRGKVYFCPLVHVKTGKLIGFDDFFGYQQITPTLLKPSSVQIAEDVAKKAVHTLGLRSTSAHVELMKTEDGWKVIEVGPRIGGFRHIMYHLSYNINHSMNDVLIHAGKKPIIPKKKLGYSVAMKFFAKKEGKLKKLSGIKKAQTLASFNRIYINKKIGDSCAYAKNGGTSVFNIILFNKDRSKLLADIRRLEQMIRIDTV